MNKKLLIILFVGILCLPNLLFPVVKKYIDSENHENRIYTDFPELSLSNLQEIPSQIENYYVDRLPFKNQMKRIQSKIDNFFAQYESNFMIIASANTVTIGVDNWLFYTTNWNGENSMADYMRYNTYTEEKEKDLANSYQTLNNYMNEQRIEFILFIPPNKEEIYPEYMPIKQPQEPSRVEHFVDYLNQNTDITAIYPYDLYLSMKDSYQLYYKYDTHWNKIGSFLGEQEICKALDLVPTNLSDVDITKNGNCDGDLANILGMSQDFNDDILYNIENYHADVNSSLVETYEDANGGYYHFTSNAKDTRNVLILGDSFGGPLAEYLSKEFSDVQFVTNPELAKEIIDNEQPDIVILEIVERMEWKQETYPDILMNP